MDSGKDARYSPYSTACGQCQANGWPNNKKGRTCFLGWKPLELEDFYRNKHQISSFDELVKLYQLSESQRIEKTKKQLGILNPSAVIDHIQPDPFADWLVKRGICPHALIESNSRYHFENVVMLDSEMGLSLPDPKLSIGETPSIFFQALSIVRSERAKVREEENAQNNRDKDRSR